MKKKLVLFACIFSLGSFIYLNLCVRSEVQHSNYEAKIEDETRSTAEFIAPDLKMMSHFIEVSLKVFGAKH